MPLPVPSHEDATIDPTEPSSRLRLVACRLSRIAGGRSSVTVDYMLPYSTDLRQACAADTSSPAGDLRLAAVATLDAITTATGGAFTAEVIGVKPLRAFDSTLVVVAMFAHLDGTTRRLVGTALADADVVGSVAIATLQAVNRIVAPLLSRSDEPS